MQRFPADGAARIAHAKSMSIDSYGDINPTVYSEYLLENFPDIQRQERGRRSAGRLLYPSGLTFARLSPENTPTPRAKRRLHIVPPPRAEVSEVTACLRSMRSGRIQDLSHLQCQGVGREGLLDKAGVGVQSPVMDDRVIRIA
jgi:hypothetical protein